MNGPIPNQEFVRRRTEVSRIPQRRERLTQRLRKSTLSGWKLLRLVPLITMLVYFIWNIEPRQTGVFSISAALALGKLDEKIALEPLTWATLDDNNERVSQYAADAVEGLIAKKVLVDINTSK